MELLGSCSKKSSTSPANKCLRDWFFKYFSIEDFIATSSYFGMTSYQRLVYPNWYIRRLFIFLLRTNSRSHHYKQIRISVTAWIATRELNYTKYIFRYYFNVFDIIRYCCHHGEMPWRRENLDKTCIHGICS